jgi:hypothetical protein
MTRLPNAQRRTLLTELLLPPDDSTQQVSRERLAVTVPIILGWWDESLASLEFEMRGLLADLTRLAQLCRELSAAAAAREDRVRISGKTSAYEHAAELTKALCPDGALDEGGGQYRSERRAFLAGWAARQTAYGGMVEGAEKALAAFLRLPNAFDQIAMEPTGPDSAYAEQREIYIADIALAIKAWGHYPWTQDPRGVAEPIYDTYIAPLIAELKDERSPPSPRASAANAN